MRRYKNLQTGVIVEVESELISEVWQEIKTPASTTVKKPEKQKETSEKKKAGK